MVASNLLTLTADSYDAASRLSTVTAYNSGLSSIGSATYGYLEKSPLVDHIQFSQGGNVWMTTKKTYDFLNRLTSISSIGSASGSSPISFNYSYNAAGQRIRSALPDGSYWLYQYDSLGQVVYGHKFWSDQTPVAGQQFDYSFDTIGNRKQTKVGGDQNGANQRVANYSANTLNQYSQRDVPGYVSVIGMELATNSLYVNGNTPYRWGDYRTRSRASSIYMGYPHQILEGPQGTNRKVSLCSNDAYF